MENNVVECPDCVQSSGYIREKNRYVQCDTCHGHGIVEVEVIPVAA